MILQHLYKRIADVLQAVVPSVILYMWCAGAQGLRKHMQT